LFRQNKLHQITKDHSWVNELLEDKEISIAEAKTFKKKNVVTRVLGTQYSTKVDFNQFFVKNDDIIMLCSDGLTGPLRDVEIQKIISSNTDNLEDAVNKLILSANNAGGPDNSTVMLIKITSAAKSNSQESEFHSPLTITDKEEEALKIEDKIIKNIFQNKPLVIPKEKKVKKPLKDRLAVFGIISALTAFLCFSIYSLYENLFKNKQGANKNLIYTGGNFDPDIMTGYLEIITDPSGAEIYINNSQTPVGLSPLTVPFEELDPERKNIHYVKLRKYGFLEIESQKEIIAHDTVTLAVTLSPEAIIELYLGIDEIFPETGIVMITPLKVKLSPKKLTTILKLNNLAYHDGIPAGDYMLEIIDNGISIWEFKFRLPKNKKAKIYLSKDKGREIIQYENIKN